MGKPFFEQDSVFLPYERVPGNAQIEIALGGEQLAGFAPRAPSRTVLPIPPADAAWERLKPAGTSQPNIHSQLAKARKLEKFHAALCADGMADTYEAAHVRLALECLETAYRRFQMLDAGKLKSLPNSVSQEAADHIYFATAEKLADGLEQAMGDGVAKNPPSSRARELFKRAAR